MKYIYLEPAWPQTTIIIWDFHYGYVSIMAYLGESVWSRIIQILIYRGVYYFAKPSLIFDSVWKWTNFCHVIGPSFLCKTHIFIYFTQGKHLQKDEIMLFILPKKLFSFSRYSIFCNFLSVSYCCWIYRRSWLKICPKLYYFTMFVNKNINCLIFREVTKAWYWNLIKNYIEKINMLKMSTMD